MLVFICVLLIFSVYYNEEPSNDDDNERVIPDVEVQETAEKPTASVEVEETAEFGPHLKLSRGEELCRFQKGGGNGQREKCFMFLGPFS